MLTLGRLSFVLGILTLPLIFGFVDKKIKPLPDAEKRDGKRKYKILIRFWEIIFLCFQSSRSLVLWLFVTLDAEAIVAQLVQGENIERWYFIKYLNKNSHF